MEFLGTGRIRWIRIRITILVTTLIIGGGAVAHGAWNLGVNRRVELTDLAKEQYKRRITLPARRGMISDRHGEELAVEVEIDSIYANAKDIEDPLVTAQMLAPILKIESDTLFRKMSSKRSFVWLKRRVPPDEAEQIRTLNPAGINMIKESKRFYPSRSLASHVLGFAGIDAIGLEGVELKFEQQLKGQKNAVHGLRDARGRVIFADSVFGPKGVVGNTVELTIDRTLQHIVEHELAATVRTFNAKSGSAIIMDPINGEVLALANWPTFNPNSLGSSSPDSRRNRAALDVLEPGSTQKIFTLAAALNAGAIRPDDSIFCEHGLMKMGDRVKVVIHDDHRDGWLTPNQCLKRSSNICFAKMALKLGKKRLYHYMRRFGFGERTHIDLPFESRGTLRHFKKSRDVDAAMMAFGQGIGVTSLQLATALSAIANGGTLMRPLLVRKIVNPNGETVRSFAPEKRRRVVSRYTARLVGDIMTSVTEEGGTGTEGALDGFLVAGKTGTAQKSVGERGYSKNKWVASFIGFVPADNPKLAITVVIDEPLINHYGGTVAAPALRRIADQSLRYLGISSRQKKTKRGKRTRIKKTKRKATTPSTESSNLDEPEIDVFVELDPSQVIAPKLHGMTMKEAIETLAANELRPLFQGTGFVAEQIPPPGDPIEKGSFIQVNFQPQDPEETPPTEIEEDHDNRS